MGDIYKPFNQYALRTPSFPLNQLCSIILKNDLDIDEIINDTAFMEALLISSTDIVKLLDNYESLDFKKKEKLKSTLLKYKIRSTSRATPFGLFSQCSINKFNNEINSNKEIIRITRLNLKVISDISKFIFNEEIYKSKIKYYPNSSIYNLGKENRFIDFKTIQGKNNYSLQKIKANKYLDKVLSICKTGSEIENIYQKLVLYNDQIEPKKLKLFIKELINNKILLSELEPCINGEDYLNKLIETIEVIDKNTELYKKLLLIKKQLNSLDKKDTIKSEVYIKLKKVLSFFGINGNISDFIQTDKLAIDNESLPFNINKNLIDAIKVLGTICPPKNDTYFDFFKKRFFQRYENQEIPLAHIFDDEIGLFNNNPLFDSDLLNGLKIKSVTDKKESNRSFFNGLLLNKILKSRVEKTLIVEITKEDIGEENTIQLANTFSSSIEVYNHSLGRNIFLNYAGGSTALNMISRFSQSNEEFKTFVDEVVHKENQLENKRIIAEIDFIPYSKLGNILRHNVQRESQIKLIVGNGKQKTDLNVKDLYVKIIDNKIRLRSKSLNKEIIPILSNAHNYMNDDSIPIYKFLSRLQFQENSRVITFYWNELLEKQQFLPRVIYKNFIFHKARWKVNIEELTLFKKFSDWKDFRNIPDNIQTGDNDELLFLNLKSDQFIKLFKKILSVKKEMIIQEFLFNSTNGVKINNEFFSNEYLICFYKNEV